MEGAFRTGEALNKNSGIDVDKYAHTMGWTASCGTLQK
jgi:hypothetical protein